MYGLRGEKPSNLEEIGLKEFYLHHNQLSDYFIKTLSKTIKNDEYLRVIDLRYNKINEASLKGEFLTCLRNNSALTNVDLRHNKGFTLKIK